MEITVSDAYKIADSVAHESALELTKEVLITTDEEFNFIKGVISKQVLIHLGVKIQ